MPNQEQHIPIDLPPDALVLEFAGNLVIHGLVELSMLDVGCSTGRNTRYLAKQGHSVLSVDNDPSELRDARYLAKAHGLPTEGYFNADARNLPNFGRLFDGVLLLDMSHLVPKVVGQRVLEIASHLVTPGGFFVASSYVADPTVRTERNKERSLQPGFLTEMFTGEGWDIRFSREIRNPSRVVNGKEQMNSRDQIIAQKLR